MNFNFLVKKDDNFLSYKNNLFANTEGNI